MTHSGHANSSAPSCDPDLEQTFNDDLLLSQADQSLAKRSHPEIFHVLDNPDLRKRFQAYDRIANKAKRVVLALGFASIVLAGASLLIAALSPLFGSVIHRPPGPWLHTVGELCALLWALIVLGGLWIFRQKKRWLRARLLTERIRQWHFQTLLYRGAEIEKSCLASDPMARKAFQDERSRWFSTFLADIEGHVEAYLARIVGDEDWSYQPLHDPRTAFSAHSPIFEKICRAYCQLRLKHQSQYASYKLRATEDEPIWCILRWPARVFERRVATLSSTSLLVGLLAAVVSLLGRMAGQPWANTTLVPVIIMSATVLSSIVRALLDGLGVRDEIERYQRLLTRTEGLADRFRTAATQRERFVAMETMEMVAEEELREFLRAHHRARFLV